MGATSRPSTDAATSPGSGASPDSASSWSTPELPGLSLAVVSSAAALGPFVTEWQDLADHAAEPNVFYEPWMLLPALRAFAPDKRSLFVLIYAGAPLVPTGHRLLCGFVPLSRERGYGRLPGLSAWRLLRHPHLFLCTPLLRRNYVREAVDALLAWVRQAPGRPHLVEWRRIAADGPFDQALTDYLRSHDLEGQTSECYTRPFLRTVPDAAEYLRGALSGKGRREVERLQRRLAKLGTVAYEILDPGDDADSWIEDFMAIEASGWKGRVGSALLSAEASQAYFREVAREAHRRGRLMMLRIALEGRPIAMKCSFLAGDGAFAYKIGFDEAYRAYSPGVQLELENIAHVNARKEIRWMDSCAVPGHAMLSRLWTDRRTMKSVLLGTGRPPGGLVVAVLPLLRWCGRLLRRWRSPHPSNTERSTRNR